MGFLFVSLLFPAALMAAVFGREDMTLAMLAQSEKDERKSLETVAFEYAVEEANAKFGNRFKFVAKVLYLKSSSAFAAEEEVCKMLSAAAGGVAVVFGPSLEPAASQIQLLCAELGLGHATLLRRPEPCEFCLCGATDPTGRPFSLNLAPSGVSIGNAVAAVVTEKYKWRSLAFLYEFDSGVIDMQALLAYTSTSPTTGKLPKIRIRKLTDRHYPELLKELIENSLETNFLIHASVATTRLLLSKAALSGFVGPRYNFILVHPDSNTLDLATYKGAGSNITTVQFLDDDNDRVSTFVQALKRRTQHWPYRTVPPAGVAVLYDSVMVMAEEISRHSNDGQQFRQRQNCSQNPYKGFRLSDNFSSTFQRGVTGALRVDKSTGLRTDYELAVMEITEKGQTQIGKWTETKLGGYFNVTRSATETVMDKVETLENRSLRVTVYLEEPFVMLKLNHKQLNGNDRYEGYCIDLLKKIAEYRNFNYVIQVVKDKAYGTKLPNGRWNGLVGELERDEADLALTSLTITYSRSEVIDFTVPFMHLGISILFKRPPGKDPGLFTFLSPLSLDVWIYMLAAYVGVSLMLWLLARFSPYEWFNPHPCDETGDVVENQFSMLNSFWFTVGSLMQQGSDLQPRAASTRLIAGIWWFFTLILISSYTANLAAFLTVERMATPIESADDLAKQSKIKYGSLQRGSTATFFKESKIQTYERMWAFMSSAQPSVFVNSSVAGIQRVKQGDYAYLMESSMLEYAAERDCELMQINGLLDSKGYGIGLRKGSAYREAISTAILMLQEKTVLTELKEKWWKHERGGNLCAGLANTKDKNKGHNALGLQNVGGVFVVLLGGLCIAFLIALLEFLHKSRRHAEIDKRNVCSVIWQELVFAMKCRKTMKPARSEDDDGRPPPAATATRRQTNEESVDDLVPSAQPYRSAAASFTFNDNFGVDEPNILSRKA